jgi:phosphoesterase RecJ-like protein
MPQAQVAAFEAIDKILAGATSVALCPHVGADGDALGSILAMAELLRLQYPSVREVTLLLPDDKPVPPTYAFMPGSERFVKASSYTGTPEVFLALDLPAASRLGKARAIAERAGRVVVMDHHPAEGAFGEPHLERRDAAATGVIVAEFVRFVGQEFTPSMALNLMTSIMTDTGCFQYQNANSEAFCVASELVNAGADPARISLEVYQSSSLPYLHLKSMVMGRIVTFAAGAVAYSYATREDMCHTGVRDDECDGLIDVVRSVRGSRVALFLKETADGNVRGNLRSKCELDVSSVARALGGGGHPAAAGFTFEGPLDEAFAQAMPLLCALVEGE